MSPLCDEVIGVTETNEAHNNHNTKKRQQSSETGSEPIDLGQSIVVRVKLDCNKSRTSQGRWRQVYSKTNEGHLGRVRPLLVQIEKFPTFAGPDRESRSFTGPNQGSPQEEVGEARWRLTKLGFRLLHILKRLLPISVYLLQKEGEFLSGHEVFLKRVASAFNNFAESTERACREKCMEDLVSTTRYVTWSLHNKESSFGFVTNDKLDTKARADVKLSHLATGIDSNTSMQTTEMRLTDLLDSTLWNRRLAPSSERIVYALVQQIFHGIREYFLASAELKFNCFLLMPVVDKLPALLREDLESAFEDDIDNVFDITNLRHSLRQQKRETEIELKRIQRLKGKFRQIHEAA
ncbi:P-loop containing nucleoside triphosphate hydrolases superfamily protein [Actinidia rufa]|uniref:P-loop containing nucleoside triphosphate hydrolases superfamily protein n=1 Tax=Actinidia rufa TaxID=165716 RepID=A0A7J0H129_9ERIC|nr:P-loop containing nucleoside triphosphate hydrolases superfamily protein [Actinidia rufa]